ncbi:hypothetical protein HMPREF9944_00225 [Segatella maculosa OT 289]|uniref:Uncharacterized protein n=1 Tax=Segatella maculosa OT 289 TaxID=999422 RepID=H1HJ81_9BACT|nr:hypothetical protein HMPREF9944_00225 [Segatella maculosa OT 289]
MEDDHSFYIFLFLPWKKIFSVKISFIFHGRRASFLHFFISSMEDVRFFSVQPLSTMVEAPRPFDFLISGGARLAFYASLFEKQFFLTGSFAHANRVTLSERVGENLFAYAIFDIVLNGAFQRPCTKLYVISFRCNEFFGRVRD